MKAPSKSISRSLRAQSSPGRNAQAVTVSKQSGSDSMTVPGEGGVCPPPGEAFANRQGDRSTKPYANAVGGLVGGKS